MSQNKKSDSLIKEKSDAFNKTFGKTSNKSNIRYNKYNQKEEMSYRCSGKRDIGQRCKIKVAINGGFCSWHSSQEVKKLPCKCFLPNGSPCSCPAMKNDLCEFHQRSYTCQGKTILGEGCLKAISSGKYCWNCSNQEGVIMDGVKAKTDEIRGFLLKEGTPVINNKKLVSVYMGDKITIPTTLKKIEIAKPDDCCICMEPMTNQYRALGCGHYLHDDCTSKMYKMECPMCRTPIPGYDVPKWVAERIALNAAEYAKQKRDEQTAATHQLVQNILTQQILDMNSSEEEDFNHHLANGSEMNVMNVSDNNGNSRMAIVFLGNH